MSNFELGLSDDILPSIPMPETTMSNVHKICTNSAFNNCTINFVVKKWIVAWYLGDHTRNTKTVLHIVRVKLTGKSN